MRCRPAGSERRRITPGSTAPGGSATLTAFLRRRARCRLRDDRVRHGHRQGRRPLGRPLGAPALAGGVLPAGGPRRPRRAAGALHAPLCTARQGPHRPLHQPRAAGPDRPDRRCTRPSPSGPTTGASSGCASATWASTSRGSPWRCSSGPVRSSSSRRPPARPPAGSPTRSSRSATWPRRSSRAAASSGAGGTGSRRSTPTRRAAAAARAALLGYFSDAAVERGARPVLRRVRSGCRAPARRRGARGRCPRSTSTLPRARAARRRRDRGPRRAHAHRPDPARLARAGARRRRPRPARLVRRARSALVRRRAPRGRLADRLRGARADRRPLPARAPAGRAPRPPPPETPSCAPRSGRSAGPVPRRGSRSSPACWPRPRIAELRALAAAALGAIGGERAAAALRRRGARSRRRASPRPCAVRWPDPKARSNPRWLLWGWCFAGSHRSRSNLRSWSRSGRSSWASSTSSRR